MKGDFSKWELIRENINGVLHQQGRVLLDRDWNDQTRLSSRWQDHVGQAMIGPGVVAVPSFASDALQVVSAKVENDGTQDLIKLKINPGSGWADGQAVHLPGKDVVGRVATYLDPPLQTPAVDISSIKKDTRDAVVLEVWRESLNGFQYGDNFDAELLEPALGGVDTTERVLTTMRFRLLRLVDGDTCGNIFSKMQDDKVKWGKLKVSLKPQTITPGDCPVVAGGGFTGFEHSLYRIEIAHVNDTSKTMFKWSQFNGGLVGRGKFDNTPNKNKFTITANKQAITTSNLDEFYLEALEYNPQEGFWQVIYGAKVVLDGNDLNVVGQPLYKIKDPSSPVFFRLWNGIDDISLFPVAATPKQLEHGIHLEFDNVGNYRAGDYWNFDVRVDYDNDQVLIDSQAPHGIRYHRLPLAILHWDDDANAYPEISFSEGQISDCRDIFRPLTRQAVCCTFVVGDGESSFGDFNSLEEALRHLPKKGGKICLLPGKHWANLEIKNLKNIQIVGCGLHTIVQPHPKNAQDPIFSVSLSENIKLENMTLITYSGTAIQVVDPPGSQKVTRGVIIADNRITASVHAVDIRVDHESAGGNDIHILSNQIGMLDVLAGKAAIFSIADAVRIEGNRVVVIPAPDPENPHDPRRPWDRETYYPDPCEELELRYRRGYPTEEFIYYVLLYISEAPHLYIPRHTYAAQGGIQIGVGSEEVAIIQNWIIGGAGNGITLGHLPASVVEINNPVAMLGNSMLWMAPDTPAVEYDGLKEVFSIHPGSMYGISIEDNVISNMGLSGIGSAISGDPEKTGLMMRVEDLTIYRNAIKHCVQQLPTELPAALAKKMGFGGISLVDCENVMIRENRIEDNGLGEDGFITNNPVCGLFVFHGEKIDISDNRILNNGPWHTESIVPVRQGVRGGIVIQSSFKSLPDELASKELSSPDGIPAVKVHDNIVTQPLGQALFITAFGPVSVIGNHLTTQACDFRLNPISLLAGTVFILNLGISKDLLRSMPARFMYLAAASDPTYNRKLRTGNANLIEQIRNILYLPSGHVLFTNNQITLDLRSDEVNFALSSQLIASLDDVAYNSNQSECTSLVDYVLTDVAVLAVSIRTNDNRFQEGFTAAVYSLFSYGAINLAATNQATHCLQALGIVVKKLGNMVIYNERCPEEEKKLQKQYVPGLLLDVDD
jgi:hypothetical protein